MLLPHPIAGARRYALALVSVRRPLLVQLVVTRRCNLACGYCHEYDDVSPPVRPRCSKSASITRRTSARSS